MNEAGVELSWFLLLQRRPVAEQSRTRRQNEVSLLRRQLVFLFPRTEPRFVDSL